MQSSASASDLGKNVACFGRPNERLGFGVMHGDVIVDGRFEVSEAGEHAATNALVGDVSEETLDHIQPGGTGGSEITPPAISVQGSTVSFGTTSGSASEIERTNFDSTAKEFIMGLVDPGQLMLEVDQDNSDAGQIALMTAQVTGLLKNFKLLLPNGNTATFTAFVKKFNSQGAVDQAVRRSIDLRISGPISWA